MSPECTTSMFLGFLPKLMAARTSWLACPRVEEIGSASECVSRGPPDRIERWEHNEAGLYDTEEEAMAMVPPGTEGTYTMFAFRAAPVVFQEGEEHPFAPWAERLAPPPEAELSDYEVLGFDAVGFGDGGFFECSPLSCNGVATTVEVNRFCLVASLEEAWALAQDFSRGGGTVEPAWGYLVVEVLRRKEGKGRGGGG
ncbi:hypothetical protein [Chondromyces apiculatus]|uniref:Uncharacterized protein n=1 Tax=Chondromyces apiculatus DSM 436 TaxID=1192034 RepID=A0A017T8T3_9BACT|nr:hypothetical protein [Chondromyces apiculatus]EYF05006.1 Hypothetical protein CAP_3596 [Chondromyces apiculatus DSM 436]